MSKRFGAKASSRGQRNILISLLIIAIATCAFWFALGRTSETALEGELDTLNDAVYRSITHCYAIEGVYPEDLDYLIENYGLTYDHDRFLVDYRPYGADIMPDVTVIAKGDAHE